MNKEPDRNPRKALGKGLSALLPSRPPTAPPEPNGTRIEEPPPQANRLPEHFEDFQSIPLEQILPGSEQPRTSFDEGKLKELADSIQVNGVIQPITVQRIGPEKYKIIAGERRWKAAAMAGLKEIPALVRSALQHERLELALIENIQREDLNPIEIGIAFQRLATDHGLSHEQIAERTGKERSTVTNFLRLLRLPAAVRQEMIQGRLSMGHGRALLNLPDEQTQVRLCAQILAKDLSVRATEQLVKNLTTSPPEPKQAEPENAIDPNVRAALEEMATALGTRVKLAGKADGTGRLEIEYYSQEDLDRIYSVIVKQ